MNIYIEVVKLTEQGETFTIATIISLKGSAPRSNAKMIVKRDGSIIGTIGGGLFEACVRDASLKAMEACCSRLVEYTLDSNQEAGIQMLCGGTVTVFLEVIVCPPRIVMIGGGHVGYAVSKIVEFLGYRLIIADDRQELANPEKYPNAAEIHCNPDIIKALEEIYIDKNTYVVIATKDSDKSVLEYVLKKDAAYIGVIGSHRKAAIINEELYSQGIPSEKLKFIHAPVGLDIGAETPEEIALSIIAEIMKVGNSKTGLSLRETKKNH